MGIRNVSTVTTSDSGSQSTLFSPSMRAMKAYVGDEVTLQVTDATKSRKRIDAVTTTITCAEITVEDAVVVSGYVDNTEPTD